ncbi:hypothetical protein ACFL5L_00565 [candidate division KSB1 bacterium]
MLSIKTLGILLAGVFVGAVAVEILNKKKPKLMKKVKDQANKAVESTEKSMKAMKDAFVEGFTETAKPKTAS